MKLVWTRLPLRAMALVSMALGAGVLAYLAFGASPKAVIPDPPTPVDWRPVDAHVPDFATTDAQWAQYAPWGAPPAAVVEAEPVPVPPMPVGVTRGDRGLEAIFMIDGAGELRVGAGGLLPDGGRVLQVAGLRVSWTDGSGQRHEREMFGQNPAGASTP